MIPNVRIGCGQITWRGDARDRAMAEIIQVGYDGAPAGPRADFSTQKISDDFAQHGPNLLCRQFVRSNVKIGK